MANQRVESRIGKLKRTLRAGLLTATGGTGDYKQLWGWGFRRANKIINNLPEAGEEAPIQKIKQFQN